MPFPLASDVGTFKDLPIREAFNPMTFQLASDVGAFIDTPIREAMNPMPFPLASDVGTFKDLPIREAFNPMTFQLASDVGAFIDTPIREAMNPMPFPLASDVGTFKDTPIREARHPMPFPLASDVGTFKDIPIRGAFNPMTFQLASNVGAFIDTPIREAMNPMPFPLASDVGTFKDTPIREARHPMPFPLASDVGTFKDTPIREARHPMPFPLASDVGTFKDLPIREAMNPMPFPLASDIGTFKDLPIREAMNPMPFRLAPDGGLDNGQRSGPKVRHVERQQELAMLAYPRQAQGDGVPVRERRRRSGRQDAPACLAVAVTERLDEERIMPDGVYMALKQAHVRRFAGNVPADPHRQRCPCLWEQSPRQDPRRDGFPRARHVHRDAGSNLNLVRVIAEGDAAHDQRRRAGMMPDPRAERSMRPKRVHHARGPVDWMPPDRNHPPIANLALITRWPVDALIVGPPARQQSMLRGSHRRSSVAGRAAW